MPRSAHQWLVVVGAAVLFFGWQGRAGAQTNAPTTELQELRIVLEALRAENAQLQQTIRELQQSLAAAKAAAERLRSGAVTNVVAGTLSEAKVLDVNAELRAVVLDIGAAQGVRVGMPFLVLRGDRVIAELRVVEVRPQVSGAVIERVDRGITLRAGDGARVTQTMGAERRELPASEKDILWKSKR